MTTRRPIVSPIRHTFSSVTSLVAERSTSNWSFLPDTARNLIHRMPSFHLFKSFWRIELESVYSRIVMSHLSVAVAGSSAERRISRSISARVSASCFSNVFEPGHPRAGAPQFGQLLHRLVAHDQRAPFG